MISYIIIVLLSFLVVGAWLWRYKINPYFARKTMRLFLKNHPQGKRILETTQTLYELYSPINGTQLSQKERARLNLQEDAFTYGEIDFMAFMLVLSHIEFYQDEIFYDLGSGTGKAVFTAALWGNFSKVYGIELLPGLHQAAVDQLQKAKNLLVEKTKKLNCIEFQNTDFKNVDLSKANVVFVNATCISYPIWELLLKKFANLPSGARVIITTKKIPLEEFKLVYHDRVLMSWGLNSISIYLKT